MTPRSDAWRFFCVIGMSRACGESPPLGEPARKPSMNSQSQPHSGDRSGKRRGRRNRDLTDRNPLRGSAGGEGGNEHRTPLGKPRGVKRGGARGEERGLPYEASPRRNSRCLRTNMVPAQKTERRGVSRGHSTRKGKGRTNQPPQYEWQSEPAARGIRRAVGGPSGKEEKASA